MKTSDIFDVFAYGLVFTGLIIDTALILLGVYP
jgi:hypothetical protein